MFNKIALAALLLAAAPAFAEGDGPGPNLVIEVDGGVKTDNIARIAAAGADTFVAGSAIFGKPDYASVIRDMRAALA